MRLYEIYNKLSPGEKRFFLIACISSLALAIGWILFAPNGVMNYRGIQKQLQEVQNENIKLAAENQQLKVEIEKLRSDPVYLEEVARRDFGLIKKNEMVFDFE